MRWLADWPELIRLLSQRGFHPTVEPAPACTEYLAIQIFAQKETYNLKLSAGSMSVWALNHPGRGSFKCLKRR